MTSTDLVQHGTTAIAIRDDQTTFDDLQTRALAHIGVETANPADLAVFFHTCKRTGLDPFARQIYMIRRDGKQTMQTGIDGLRLVAQRTAERTRETFGYEDTLWAGPDGIWHDAWLTDNPPAAAKVTVVRNGQRFPAVALYREYVQRKRDGNVTQMWKDKGALMLAKCAEASALRKAFPMDLSGIYTPEEVRDEQRPAQQQARGMSAVRAAVTPEPPAEPAPADDEEPAEVVPDESLPLPPPLPLTDRTRKTLFALMGELGIDDPDEQRRGMSTIVGRTVESRSSLTEDEGQAIVDHLRGVKRQREIDAVQKGEA